MANRVRYEYEYETEYERPRTAPEPSLGELFSQLSAEASTLVREEVQLAQVEMKQKARRAGKGAAWVAVGAILALGGYLTIVAMFVLLLALWMEAWIAALIVGAVLLIIGAIAAVVGKNKLQEIDPAPRQTVESMRENKEWLTRQI